MPSTSLIAIIARCTTIQFADCAQPTLPVKKPRSHPWQKQDQAFKWNSDLASLVAGLEGRPLERRLQGFHRLRPARAAAERIGPIKKRGRRRSGGEEGEGGLLLEEGLDLAGLLLDAGDDGLKILVRVGVRRRGSHPDGDGEGGSGRLPCAGCSVLGGVLGSALLLRIFVLLLVGFQNTECVWDLNHATYSNDMEWNFTTWHKHSNENVLVFYSP